MTDITELKDRIMFARPEILNRVILKWDDAKFASLWPFIKEHRWSNNTSIYIFNVVGTQSHKIGGMTWLDFLERGVNMAKNLDLYEKNPCYYHEAVKKKPAMYFQSIDGGDLYVGPDGNHRTCIARCVFYLERKTVLHGVELDDYRIDWEFRRLFIEIQHMIFEREFPYQLQMMRKKVEKDESDGWKMRKYELALKIYDPRTNREQMFGKEQAVEFFEMFKKKKHVFIE